MRKLLFVIILLWPGFAFAQCNGNFAANAVCGSLSGGIPGPISSSSFPGGTPSGSAGGVLSGTYPNPGMASGAAATNVGTLGGSLLGNLPNPSIASSVNLPGSPTTTTQASGDASTAVATDAFVARATAALNPAAEVNAATVAASDTSGLTYNNGASGVGATFTGTNNTAITIDGFTFTATNQRLLVKNDTQSPSGAFNGIYYLTQLQGASQPPIFTRALDYNTPANINSTGTIPVVSGTTNAGTFWYLTSTIVTIGTSPLTYTQFTSGVTIATNPQIWTSTAKAVIDSAHNQTSLAVVAEPISTATFTPNFTNHINFSMTLVHASCPCTVANPTGAWNGLSGFMEVIQSATGSDTIGTWGSSWKFPGGTKPTLSTGVSAKDILPFFCDASNFCMVGAIQQAFQ